MKLISFVFTFLSFVTGILAQDSKIAQGVCVIHIESKNWSDKIMLSLDQALIGHKIDLSSKEAFKYSQGREDGSSKLHQGQAPKDLNSYEIFLKFTKDRDIGWPDHEALNMDFEIYERSSQKLAAGPFSSSAIRRITKDHKSPEGFPKLTVNVKLSKTVYKFSTSCGGVLKP